jgi:hypothetical protein
MSPRNRWGNQLILSRNFRSRFIINLRISRRLVVTGALIVAVGLLAQVPK